jgi:hypothetical protein
VDHASSEQIADLDAVLEESDSGKIKITIDFSPE